MILSKVDTKKVFGTIEPPPGSEFAKGSNPLGALLGTGINVFLIVAGIVALVYLLWGALDWITSEGDKEKVLKARQKIQNALIGLIVIFAALALFNLVVGTILGGKIIQPTPGGFEFNLPQLR